MSSPTPEEQPTPKTMDNNEEKIAVEQVSSEQLLKGEKELQILHHGEVYRLRVTKAGKLILNK
ncbi:hemin uptake protein HemP [Calycomorphotria hydatis]|uniref:Hemin uptake protein hemP n=1 Tax=Calycomorphotria hydatis TaxID=2528027 RepID=A0A517TAP5_9PLAN|nr:hemin uptake protein HemP [Calycomorphotria hydatis]QDT65451.1 hypothetical protein V22_27040 [Calycomorphotria hydatis]